MSLPRGPSVYFVPSIGLKTQSCYDANFVVSSGTGGYRHENLWCHQRRQIWHHGSCGVSVYRYSSVAQIPQCTSSISHNASFCSRNVHMCAHFCYKIVHCGIFVWHIVGCVRGIYFKCHLPEVRVYILCLPSDWKRRAVIMQLCRHQQHWRISLWKPLVPPGMTKLASWHLWGFNVSL